MKKLSNRDWAIATIIAVLSAITTFAITSMYYNSKEPITIENPLNIRLQSRYDSLGAVVVQRDIQDSIKASKEALSDSILNKHGKILNKYYDKLKDLDVDARISAYDSILSNYKVRR